MNLLISIPVGDAFDKLSILEIKRDHADNNTPQKTNIENEINSLSGDLNHLWEGGGDRLLNLYDELKSTNLEMWVIEDSIRLKEKAKQFDSEFIQLARDVYYTNDRRCREKNKISKLMGSNLVEEKIYESYE